MIPACPVWTSWRDWRAFHAATVHRALCFDRTHPVHVSGCRDAPSGSACGVIGELPAMHYGGQLPDVYRVIPTVFGEYAGAAALPLIGLTGGGTRWIVWAPGALAAVLECATNSGRVASLPRILARIGAFTPDVLTRLDELDALAALVTDVSPAFAQAVILTMRSWAS